MVTGAGFIEGELFCVCLYDIIYADTPSVMIFLVLQVICISHNIFEASFLESRTYFPPKFYCHQLCYNKPHWAPI